VDNSRFDVECCAASRWITVATVATVAVRYLSTLDKYTAALYTGDPSSIIDALPGLMNNIKMMLTIARCAIASSLALSRELSPHVIVVSVVRHVVPMLWHVRISYVMPTCCAIERTAANP
jgi:hypothetical protein